MKRPKATLTFSGSSTTITIAEPRKGPGCEHCNHEGEVLYFYPRPGGNPGNQMIPCPKCYKSEDDDQRRD